ncbi:MAG: RnfABCDGE type electron transport complex subunit D [Treponema sp.]|nr:RnfABCDGE type electron transport complex subunit D [Treponema sp.]
MKNNDIEYKIKNTPVLMKPYFFSIPSISAVSIKILILLGIQILLLIFTKSYSALFVILSSTLGATIAALINYAFQKVQPFTIMTVMIQGVLIGMLLPETYPPVTVFFIAFTILVIEKYLFVNCVNSWINVVCVAVIIAYFIGQSFFPGFIVTNDLFPVKNASLYLIQNGSFPTYSFDSSVTEFLNNSIFNWVKVTLPNGFVSFLWDTHSLIPAFRFNIVTILSSIVLFCDGGISPLIPGIFIGVYAVLVRLFFPALNGGLLNTGDIILAIGTSGTIFCSVFLLQWFGTHPITLTGKILFAVISGVIAFLIVGCGTSPIGMIYTIVISNILNLLIRVVEEKNNVLRLSKLVNTELFAERETQNKDNE